MDIISDYLDSNIYPESQILRPILLQGHERALTQIRYNKDGDIIFSTAKDQHTFALVDVDPTTTIIASGAADNTVRLWDVKTGKCLKTWDFNTAVKRVEFNEDATQLLAVTEQQSKATVAGWSYMSKFIIAGHEDGSVSQYDAKTGELLYNTQVHEPDLQVTDLQWSPDRTYFITASKDKSAKVNNAASITPKKDFVILGGGQAAMDVTTTSARQGKFEARFYHKIFEEEIGRVRGHFGPLNTVAVDPNGKGYASGGEDGYVRVHQFDKGYFDFTYEVERQARQQ
ncbi:hypothetical protein DID88_001969 [Monilinia fructigena]|uniref:Serine-threonine kinase receptor-associated protein n=1 Tax=Monilinia fructigena TaxID=38457 RepID=A0A395IX99_9HELO|nr:hypothetical protein DID88_001969 [Monilinia fructigena]